MRILNQNTLVDIARHSNKTLKMADFMARAGYPFLYGEMARVESETPAIEAIEAFKKDLDKTVTQMGQVHELLSTVNENDNVVHLKNDEKNLATIFGDAYDKKTKTIKFSSCQLELTKPFDKESCLNQMTQSLLNQSSEKFKQMFKTRNKTFKLDDKSLYTDEDKIYFLSIIKSRDEYAQAVEKIRGFGEGFGHYRSKLSLEDKNQIDNEITFNRSMIDSVTLNSTYITKEDGVVKLGTPHKKENSKINKIADFIKENDFIKAIELDPDTSLDGVIDVLQKTRDINFNLDNEIVFKVRKLGNYRAHGLYMGSQKIVAVDIKNPSAAIHEFVHAVDLGRDDIRHSKQRLEIADKYRQRINADDLPESEKGYYLRADEIIARLGEIGYVLNQYDFKENESLEGFRKRVKEEEKTEQPYDLNLAWAFDDYLEQMPNEYFNVKSMSKNDLMEVKSYYQTYFGVKNANIKPIELIEVSPEESAAKVVRQTQKHKLTPVSFFSRDNIEFALNYNKNEQLIDFTKVFDAFFENAVEVDRSVKKYNNETLEKQSGFFKKLGEWVREENNPYLTAELMKSLYSVDRNARQSIAFGVRDALIYGKELSVASECKEELDKLEENKEKYDKHLAAQKGVKNAKYSESMITMRRNMRIISNKVEQHFREIEKERFPEIQENYDKKRNAYAIERLSSGAVSKTLTTDASGRLFGSLREQIAKSLKEHGPDKVLSCLGKDELMVHNLIGDHKYREKIFGVKNIDGDELKEVLKSGINNGLVEDALKNSSVVYQYPILQRGNMQTNLSLSEALKGQSIIKEVLPQNLKEEIDEVNSNEKKFDLILMNTETKALTQSQIDSYKKDYVFEDSSKKENNDLRDFVSRKDSSKKSEVSVEIETPKENKRSPSSGQLKLF